MIYCKTVPVFVLVFPQVVTMLIFQIKRIQFKSEKWFNYLVTFFFGKCQENFGRLDDAKRKKERERGCLRFNQTSELAQTA